MRVSDRQIKFEQIKHSDTHKHAKDENEDDVTNIQMKNCH